MNNKKIIVNLDNGYLEATASTDPEYPGIYIEYIAFDDNNEDLSRPTILFEKPKDSNKLRALIWRNKKIEDYTDKIEFD